MIPFVEPMIFLENSSTPYTLFATLELSPPLSFATSPMAEPIIFTVPEVVIEPVFKLSIRFNVEPRCTTPHKPPT